MPSQRSTASNGASAGAWKDWTDFSVSDEGDSMLNQRVVGGALRGQVARPGSKEARAINDERLARDLQSGFDQEVAAKVARATFECPLCFDSLTFDESVELDCLHRFCQDCFGRHLELKIREKRVREEELSCPMPGCGCKVTDLQVEGAVRATPLWDRFLATRAQSWRPRSGDGDKLCQCPTPNCGSFLVPGGTAKAEVRCPECKVRFCAHCEASHPGVSCKQFAAKRREEARQAPGEAELAEAMRQEGWQRCPKCSAICERQQGCNYMTCPSDVCRGKTNFCYVCGDELTWYEHATHFPSGPFANVCRKVDRTHELPKAVGHLGAAITDALAWMRG
eukprot:TRINITY_DN71438_c0_g1_i1.p1 TRINITY_DN71438_c0_g1~~TRINITY_DN71438_c0_g1_i1.p1  ORF type:complete len:337 (-),score=62.68 TRINITY_DN71438_c0_g1_i1:344-1354(-)